MVSLKSMYLLDSDTGTNKNRIKINLLKGKYNKTWNELRDEMELPENHSKRKYSKVKVKPEQVRYQMQHHRKKPLFKPRRNFARAFGALMGQTFSGHRPDDFKFTLDNISIYAGDVYSHETGMTLMSVSMPSSQIRMTQKTMCPSPPSTSIILSAKLYRLGRSSKTGSESPVPDTTRIVQHHTKIKSPQQ